MNNFPFHNFVYYLFSKKLKENQDVGDGGPEVDDLQRADWVGSFQHKTMHKKIQQKQ